MPQGPATDVADRGGAQTVLCDHEHAAAHVPAAHPRVNTASLADCYTDASVWDAFDPALITLASPDPQAFRPADEPKNVLQVGLPTNFKAAHFEDPAHTALLRAFDADIDAARFIIDGQSLEIPVKLKVHDSIFVPLAKWPMLLTGNYRCVQSENIDSDSRSGPWRYGPLACDLRYGRVVVLSVRRRTRGSRAVRQVCAGRDRTRASFVGGTRARRGRKANRARRPTRAALANNAACRPRSCARSNGWSTSGSRAIAAPRNA